MSGLYIDGKQLFTQADPNWVAPLVKSITPGLVISEIAPKMNASQSLATECGIPKDLVVRTSGIVGQANAQQLVDGQQLVPRLKAVPEALHAFLLVCPVAIPPARGWKDRGGFRGLLVAFWRKVQ